MKNKLSNVKNKVGKIRGSRTKDVASKAVLPYITNETVAEHREEVLSGARKYIYPLQHSRHKIVWLSVTIFIATFVALLVFTMLNLYRFQNTSTFTYRITQIVPFPIARAGGRFVSYESYLFELRRSIHYYENKQKINFQLEENQGQLNDLKKDALNQVINDAYVKRLADDNGISVSLSELEREMDISIKQNRLGFADGTLEDVLKDYYDWDINDFKRTFKQQILARKVVAVLDQDAKIKAEDALVELNAGAEFADVVARYSDDETSKANGGEYGLDITSSLKTVSPKVTEVIFAQGVGKYSEVINTGYSLEIVKTISLDNTKAKAAHIQINLRDIGNYVGELKESSPPRYYIATP